MPPTIANRSKIVVVPNFCDHSFYSSASLGSVAGSESLISSVVPDFKYSGKLTIGYFGSLGRINWPDYIVELSMYISDFAELHIFGDGACRDSMITASGALGTFNNSIFFHGSYSKADISRIIPNMDLSLVSFLPLKPMENNSSNKFFDSLSYCRPVVINYGGWHHHLLSRYRCGVRLSTSPKEAADQLRTL